MGDHISEDDTYNDHFPPHTCHGHTNHHAPADIAVPNVPRYRILHHETSQVPYTALTNPRWV